ncbi:MAG: DJ-1/PfpI family protein, partial [Eubacteriaceae bacterium]
IRPDCLVGAIAVNENSVLLLPGADKWDDPKHSGIIKKAEELLAEDATVGAICGATVVLANAGLLDYRIHTSNGPGFLEMFSPVYKGQKFYSDQPSVMDHNLITASSTGGLLWAKQILERLDVFRPDTLEAWYEYFSTGKPESFYALMETLPKT